MKVSTANFRTDDSFNNFMKEVECGLGTNNLQKLARMIRIQTPKSGGKGNKITGVKNA